MPKTDAVVPEVEQVVLSSLPPTKAQVRLALAVLLAIATLVVIAIGPLSHVRTAPVPAFVPIYVTAMIATDAITAVLLITQFAILRSRATLVLAAGYAFAALVLVPYLLTFPGLFGATGVIPGALSTAWFFVLWRAGFPLFVIAYAVLKEVDGERAERRGPVAATVMVSVALTAALVAAAVGLQVLSAASVPMLLDRLSASPLYPYFVGGPVLATSSLAVTALWFRRRSLLDSWLMVVMCLFAMEVPLSFWPNPARFSLSWYTFRGIGVIASSLVLIVLLYEIATIYVRLLRAITAQRREREARLLTGDAVAAAIAHEVRQPLSAIVTSAGAGLRFLERPVPLLDKAIESLKRIVADGHRADTVVDSVRATFKNSAPDRLPVDVNAIIHEALAFEQDDLRRHGILVQAVPSGSLPDVHGDRVQLQQVLLNLIANAIHAMAARDAPRVLSVRSEAHHEGGVLVTVADTGLGIDPQHVHRIFHPLFTTKRDGMGMGLAICRSIIEAHDGRLWVTPNTPHGSVFQFMLGASPAVSTGA